MSGNEVREFHIKKSVREATGLDQTLFSLSGTLLFANLAAAREFSAAFKAAFPTKANAELRPEDFYAIGLIDEIFHYLIALYGKENAGAFHESLINHLDKKFGREEVDATLEAFSAEFPPSKLITGAPANTHQLEDEAKPASGRSILLEEMLLLWVENQNSAYGAAKAIVDDSELRKSSAYTKIIKEVQKYFAKLPTFGPDAQDLVSMLRAPALAHPDSLQKQLEYIRDRWGLMLGEKFLRLLRGIDYLNEVNAFLFNVGKDGSKGSGDVLEYGGMEEYERFSEDRDWMPKVVLLAKTTLVWLDQLSKQYGKEIRSLDAIPDEELDRIRSMGFTGIWLIGLWERSSASKRIKHLCGNTDAVSSAYSLYDYSIASNLGSWSALQNLRTRCEARGIRLASDMVPNHSGIDSDWIHYHPDRFLQVGYPPFPSYTFNGENLSTQPGVGIYLEDHYYDRTDAAVVFKRVDFSSGHTRYIYHGNDGTHMPWNDTAQIDFLNPEAREAVIQEILHVARNFPIIRFDAAMTLAKKHIQRLWFPEPGSGGAIASRSEHGLTNADFNRLMPVEFWREVVDRVAQEVPDTLLLAEAFWMMEGYFVRTLGMHRVYNSAFMNMLKNEDNANYRLTIRNTLEFDKDIIKRFVNFMNNPDEETAIAQFGNGDKYFCVCTMMVTMPGLPMFGHGQIEGFTEKYGMEYYRAYYDETPDKALIARHEHEIFPLLKKRYLFSGSDNFYFFDFQTDSGWVNENVFAYSNVAGQEKSLVVCNNSIEQTWGHIRTSVGYAEKNGGGEKTIRQSSLAEALGFAGNEHDFMLMREQRTGLWYIRRITDIAKDGLFVSLKGYETQVYLDIHCVKDNQWGHYAMLEWKLAGTGVADISKTLRDIVLEPVYNAFSTFADAGWKEGCLGLLGSKGDTARIPDYKAAYGEFLSAVRSWMQNDDEFNNAVTKFDKLLANLKYLERVPVKVGADEKPRTKLSRFILEECEKYIPLWLATALFPIGERAEEWWLAARFGTGEELSFAANRILKLADAFWEWNYKSAKAKAGQSKDDVLSAALSDFAVQDFIGVHTYDDKVWFNAEDFERFTLYAAVFELIFAGEKSASDAGRLYARALEWQGLALKSGYLFEDLKASFGIESGKPAAKAGGKKVVAKASSVDGKENSPVEPK